MTWRCATLLCLAFGLALGAAAPVPTPSPQAKPGTAPTPASAAPPADRLTRIAQSSKLVWNGVVVAPDKRVFVEFPRLAGHPGPSLATVDRDGALTPYPGGEWNGWTKAGASDPTNSFVGLNAVHLGPHGGLWVVDTGSAAHGKPPLPGAAKLVRFDLARNVATRTVVMPAAALRPKSMIDDVRFNGEHAYVTDAGAPGLIVVDLATGAARRLLDGDPSTTARRPIVVDGKTVIGPDNKPAMINADQLEVTPDGKHLYYQPLCGPMFRIATSLLDDPRASAQAVAAGVEFWYDTPALGGTAIAPDGTLYLDDVENDSVLRLTPDRALSRVIADPRLHWPDAPFLRDGALTIPVPQLDRAAAFHHGKSAIRFPVELFNLRVAAAASPTPPPAPRR